MNDFDGLNIQLLVDEDSDWIAHLVELPNISAGGEAYQRRRFRNYGLLGAWLRKAISSMGRLLLCR